MKKKPKINKNKYIPSKDIKKYVNGGNKVKDIGAGLYGVGEGLLDTVTLGATDQFTDMGYKALQKAGGSNEDEIREQDSIRGYSNAAGAIGGAIINPAGIGAAIGQTGKGLSEGISYGSPDDENAQNISTGVGIAGQLGSLAYGNMNASKAAQSMPKLKHGGMMGMKMYNDGGIYAEGGEGNARLENREMYDIPGGIIGAVNHGSHESEKDALVNIPVGTKMLPDHKGDSGINLKIDRKIINEFPKLFKNKDIGKTFSDASRGLKTSKAENKIIEEGKTSPSIDFKKMLYSKKMEVLEYVKQSKYNQSIERANKKYGMEYNPNQSNQEMMIARNSGVKKYDVGGLKLVNSNETNDMNNYYNNIQNQPDPYWDFTKQNNLDKQSEFNLANEKGNYDNTPYSESNPNYIDNTGKGSSMESISGKSRGWDYRNNGQLSTNLQDPFDPKRIYSRISNPNPTFKEYEYQGRPGESMPMQEQNYITEPNNQLKSIPNLSSKKLTDIPFDANKYKNNKKYSNYNPAASALANNIGNFAYLANEGKKYDKVNYGAIAPKTIDFSEAIRQGNQDAANSRNNLKNIVGGNAGAYMANISQIQNANTMNKAKIIQEGENINAGIVNQANMFNKQNEIQGMRDEAGNKGQALTQYYNKLNKIGENTNKAFTDYRQGKMDMQTVGLLNSLSSRYKISLDNPNAIELILKEVNKEKIGQYGS